MTLLVSLKEKVAKVLNSEDLGNAFRQVENYLRDPLWITKGTLGTGWTNFGGGFQGFSYFKDPFSFVHVRGLVVYTGVAIPNGGTSTIFTLPPTYTPPLQELYISMSNPNVPCRIDITKAGAINVTNLTGGAQAAGWWVSLGNYSFRTF